MRKAEPLKKMIINEIRIVALVFASGEKAKDVPRIAFSLWHQQTKSGC